MVIRNSNSNLVTQLDLHDAEIGEMICNYCSKTVRLSMVLHCRGKENVKAKLYFEGVSNIVMGLLEPWGEGFYVNEATTGPVSQEAPEGSFAVTLLLNSGDKIELTTRTVTYTEEI